MKYKGFALCLDSIVKMYIATQRSKWILNKSSDGDSFFCIHPYTDGIVRNAVRETLESLNRNIQGTRTLYRGIPVDGLGIKLESNAYYPTIIIPTELRHDAGIMSPDPDYKYHYPIGYEVYSTETVLRAIHHTDGRQKSKLTFDRIIGRSDIKALLDNHDVNFMKKRFTIPLCRLAAKLHG